MLPTDCVCCFWDPRDWVLLAGDLADVAGSGEAGREPWGFGGGWELEPGDLELLLGLQLPKLGLQVGAQAPFWGAC